jgi:hypothetical protein
MPSSREDSGMGGLIAKTMDHIAVHQALVARLASEGKDTTRAEAVLDILIEVHAHLCACVVGRVQSHQGQQDASVAN